MCTIKDIVISQLCIQDITSLVKHFCFPWDTPEKTKEKLEYYFEEHQKNRRTVGVVKRQDEIVGYGSLL